MSYVLGLFSNSLCKINIIAVDCMECCQIVTVCFGEWTSFVRFGPATAHQRAAHWSVDIHLYNQ